MSGLDFLAMLQTRGVVTPAQAERLKKKLADPSKPVTPERLAKYLIDKGEVDAKKVARVLKEFKASQASTQGLMQLSEADVVEEVIDLGAMAFGDDDYQAGGGERVVSVLDPLQSNATPQPAEGERQARIPFQARKILNNRWESKWMIIGPTLIIVLLMSAAFLYFVLVRRDAEKILDAAEARYHSQGYAEAIKEYSELLKTYPKHPKASMAKVRIGMARIRTFSDSSQWEKALNELPVVLPTIENEPAFPEEGRADLAAILPKIADGFVSQADRSNDVEAKQNLLDLCGKAMVYVDNSQYIPTSIRRQIESTLTKLKEDYARVERSILQERKLVTAISNMDKAVEEGTPIRSFEVRKELLREFPVLEGEQRLVEAAMRASLAEQALVIKDGTAVTAIPPDFQADLLGTVALASRVGATATELAGEIHPVLVRGSVYMIDVTNGNLLWRRFVGYETLVQPSWVNERGGDILLANQHDHEVLRVEGRTGRVIWRTGIGEPFGSLSSAGAAVMVATRTGRLVRLALDETDNVAAGSKIDALQFPQALTVGPAADRTGQFLYQPGLQANLYVMEAATDGQGGAGLECREVYYLGHRPGSIAVPPVLVQGLLFIVENSGTDYSTLHILKPTQRGLGLQPAQSSIRLRGEVLVTTEMYGPQGLLVLTDRGEIRLFRVDPTTEDEDPVQVIAGFERQIAAGTFSQFLADKGRLWVGDNGLSTFSIQVQRGQLDRSGAFHTGHQYVAPFGLYGRALVQTRVRAGSQMVSVSATDIDSMEEIWRTDLAAPLAGTPFVELDGTAVAINSQGDQFVLDQSLIDAQVGSEPRRRGSNTEQDLVFTSTVDMGNGRVICFGPPEKQRVLGIDPSERVNTAPLSDSDIPNGSLAFAPLKFGDRILAGSTEGPLFLLDPLRGKSVGTPFQPAIGPGTKIAWSRPAILDDQTFVAGDSSGNIYRVVRQGNGLAKDDEGQLGAQILTPMAARAGIIYVGTVTASTPNLMVIDATNLASQRKLDLPAQINFGPQTIGEEVLIGTTDSMLHGVAEDGSLAWSAALDSGFAVGASQIEGAIWVAISDGRVLKVNPGDGQVLSILKTGEPLGGAPFLHSGRVFVPAFDGTLCVLPKD